MFKSELNDQEWTRFLSRVLNPNNSLFLIKIQSGECRALTGKIVAPGTLQSFLQREANDVPEPTDPVMAGFTVAISSSIKCATKQYSGQ